MSPDSEKTSGEAVLFNYTELEMVNNPFAATAENPKKLIVTLTVHITLLN